MNKTQKMYIEVEAREDWINVNGSESKFYPYTNDERLKNIYVSRKGEVARKYATNDEYYIVKQQEQKNGYVKVGLHVKDDKNVYKTISKLVHRLVLETFLPQPDTKGKWVVDHINGKRYDNRLENLQWLTLLQNLIKRDEAGSLNKDTYVYDRVTDTVTHYDSRLLAAEAIDYFVSNMVTAMKKEVVIRGRYFVTDADYLLSEDYYYIFKECDLKKELRAAKAKKQQVLISKSTMQAAKAMVK